MTTEVEATATTRDASIPRRWWVNSKVIRIIWGAASALLLALLAEVVVAWGWPKVTALMSVSKVTVLVPVQGDARPADGGPELFEDKISNDIVQTLTNAKAAFVSAHPAPSDAHPIVEFLPYSEGRTAEERIRIAESQIAEAAKAKQPVVAVIGHTTSQATIDTAPVYAEHGISVLIPFATRTGIAEEVTRPRPDGKQVPRALAFPPSNKSQAHSIGEFLKKRSVKSVVIFRDAANRAYSDDCGNELVKILENDTTAESKPPIEIVADISVGGDVGRWYYTREVATARADAYVIITMAKPSLEIVRQVVRSSPALWPKLIVLTDGAIDDYLVPRIAPTLEAVSDEDAKRNVAFPPVYIFFPESDVQPKGYDAIFKKGAGVKGLSHAAYVSDAIFAAYAVARETVGDARRGNAAAVFARKLDEFIGYNAKMGASLSGNKVGRDYQFLPTGARALDADYTVYELDPSTINDPAVQGYKHPVDGPIANSAH